MKIRLEIFEGPLDLLLYLIKKNHLDVEKIALTEVVDQYLQFLDLMKMLDINVASEYMVIAATLISIKSKMLLPRQEEEIEDELDPRQELVQKLLEYEKFKEAADYLKDREHHRNKFIRRPQADIELGEEDFYFEASIFDLINAFKSALKDVPKDTFFDVIKDEFTVEEKIHDILHMLLVKNELSLDDLFANAQSKVEIVVIFLAILELIKLREIAGVQKHLFGPISIIRRDSVETNIQK